MAKFSFSNFFGNEEEEIDKEELPKQPKSEQSNKVISMQHQKRLNKSEISLFEPHVYSDSKNIAKKLIDNNAIIVNFENADNNSIKRIIDFLNGTIFTINGNIERISEKVFLFTPNNYSISGDVNSEVNHRYE